MKKEAIHLAKVHVRMIHDGPGGKGA